MKMIVINKVKLFGQAVLMALALMIVVMIVGPAQAEGADSGENKAFLPLLTLPDVFHTVPSENSFNFVTTMDNAGDERLFVGERKGSIYVIQPTGEKSLFLDLTDKVKIDSGGGEMGFFDIEFHPDYAENGIFYVSYTGSFWGGDDRWLLVEQYEVSATDPDVADADSAINLFRVQQQFRIHNGGGLAFRNGRLYIGVGDDSQALLAQDLDSSKGKIVRVDVSNLAANRDRTPEAWLDAYVLGNTEVWALGLRNPWRFEFGSPVQTLFIADVGDIQYEEINIVEGGQSGVNFGWPCVEGPEVLFSTGDCNNPLTRFRLPTYYYRHGDDGCAVIGGGIYKDEDGHDHYIFGDSCIRRIFVIYKDGDDYTTKIIGDVMESSSLLTTFGMDSEQGFYVGTYESPGPYYKLHFPPDWLD